MKKLLAVTVLACAWVLPETEAAQSASLLPYDSTNPVMYDNDWANDYVDWYLMVLAGAGDLRYAGISTSSSIDPYNRYMPGPDLDSCVQQRTDIVAAGRASGFRNVPDPVPGVRGHLARPASGIIEDTVPRDSLGSRAIIAEAHRATAAKPLVVCLGGPLTVVADAYLLDPSIADRMVVAWIDNFADGMHGFNGWSDGWAAYIVLERLRLVQFAYDPGAIPRLSKTWIQDNLPDSPARTYMLSLQLDVVNGGDGDADGMPAVSVMRPDYVQAIKRVSFGGWTVADGHEMPMFRDDPSGRAIVVTQASGAVASQEYQRAFLNPAAWNPSSPPPPPPPAGLVLHWTFDEGTGTWTADRSGNGNGGTLHNGASWSAGAAALDGADDVVEAADSASLDRSGALTVAAWVRYDGKTDGWQRIAVKDWGSASAPWTAYGLYLDDGPEGAQKAGFSVSESASAGAGVSSSSVIPTGEWVHLAGVYDPAAGTVALYVNGVKDAEAPAPALTVVNSPGPFLVGRSSWGAHRLRGDVDDVRVYGQALSETEVAALAAPPGAAPAPPPAGPGGGNREGENGDGTLNDSMCGATGMEALLLLAGLALRRRRSL